MRESTTATQASLFSTRPIQPMSGKDEEDILCTGLKISVVAYICGVATGYHHKVFLAAGFGNAMAFGITLMVGIIGITFAILGYSSQPQSPAPYQPTK